MGTFPRVTHPSATDPRKGPFDLHVLGLPPAFALSQDQTLKLKSSISTKSQNVLDRVLTIARRFHPACELSKRKDKADVSLVPHASPHRAARTPPPAFLSLSLNLSKSKGTPLRAPGRPTGEDPQALHSEHPGHPTGEDPPEGRALKRRPVDDPYLATPDPHVNSNRQQNQTSSMYSHEQTQ